MAGVPQRIRKRGFTLSTTYASERVVRVGLQSSNTKQSLGHAEVLKAKEAMKKQTKQKPVPPGSLEKRKNIYLSSEILTSTAGMKKKKSSFKKKTVSLSGLGLSISDSKSDILIPLESICMLHQQEALQNAQEGGSGTKSSPFAFSRKKGEKHAGSADRTLLLCMHDLTRLWLQFNEKSEFTKWLLSLDGLLGIFYSSSLLNPIAKNTFLRESYLSNREGGSIKVGDDEEWTYIGPSGRLSCSLTSHEAFKKAQFIFDGQFVRPSYESNLNYGSGEWDGLNAYWFKGEIDGSKSERQRKSSAQYCFNWNENTQEFYMMEKPHFAMKNTWKLTRNFLARTDVDDGGHSGWVQIEGDTPICLGLFLRLFYQSYEASLEETKKETPINELMGPSS